MASQWSGLGHVAIPVPITIFHRTRLVSWKWEWDQLHLKHMDWKWGWFSNGKLGSDVTIWEKKSWASKIVMHYDVMNIRSNLNDQKWQVWRRQELPKIFTVDVWKREGYTTAILGKQKRVTLWASCARSSLRSFGFPPANKATFFFNLLPFLIGCMTHGLYVLIMTTGVSSMPTVIF